MANNKIFLIGIVAGLAAALGLAAVISAISTQSTAQMMGNPNMMGPGMMTNSQGMMMNPQSHMGLWQFGNRAAFTSSGISNVDNVQITGISITGDHEVTVNLRYDGAAGNTTTTAPGVTVIALTNPSFMMTRMHSSMGMMMGGGYGGGFGYGMPMMQGYFGSGVNSTQFQQQMQAMHNQMMANGGYFGYGGSMMMNPSFFNQTAPSQANILSQIKAFQSQTGSSPLNAGWQPAGMTVKVKLDGDAAASAYDSSGIQVMVFPLTS
jgi:hypothetical protein